MRPVRKFLFILLDYPATSAIFVRVVAVFQFQDMKKTYLTPEVRERNLDFESNFLQSGGLNPGIDPLGDPEDENPWGN